MHLTKVLLNGPRLRRPVTSTNITNESPSNVLLLHVSARFAQLFSEMDGDSQEEKRPGPLAIWSVDVCSVPRLGRFVLFSEDHSLFTFIISSGYGRSLAPVLEAFQRSRQELIHELGLSEFAPISFTTARFGKRSNRHIIGSQNDLIYLLKAHLENTVLPLKEDRLRKVQDYLNQAPMSYLGMHSPRFALFGCHDKIGFLDHPG